MRTEVKTIDPNYASRLLELNVNNRKPNPKTISNYASMMKNGLWKENGESIIIDSNNEIKDGQHRLMSIVKAKKTYSFVLVTDVDPNVMDTIDTGKNRSLADIFSLEGLSYAGLKASVVKNIILYERGILFANSSVNSSTANREKFVSNGEGLEYVKNHYKQIDDLIKMSSKLYDSSKKILTATQIAKILYIISEFELKETHLEFIAYLVGKKYEEGSAASYIFDTIFKAKASKVPLREDWIIKASIKAWNMFVNGNPSIRFIKMPKEFNEKPIKV